MTPEITGLLAAATAKLHAADLLLGAGLQGDAVSRAYYAVFHAISALHLSRGNTFSRHAQLIGRFNKDFVRAGVFPPELTRILARLLGLIGGATVREEPCRSDMKSIPDVCGEAISVIPQLGPLHTIPSTGSRLLLGRWGWNLTSGLVIPAGRIPESSAKDGNPAGFN